MGLVRRLRSGNPTYPGKEEKSAPSLRRKPNWEQKNSTHHPRQLLRRPSQRHHLPYHPAQPQQVPAGSSAIDVDVCADPKPGLSVTRRHA
ncbi:hypothetical protein M8J75_001056 [Diaphorina citri]|nr:hypothetical protein M8J75_001056 [Diaphorina citri]